MRALQIQQQQLVEVTDYPLPTPQPHEVLLKVVFAGVNRADLFQVQGKYPPPEGASPLPGLEVSGEIVAIGREASGMMHAGLTVGDSVCALLEGGGYAEYVAVPATQLLPIPKNWSLAEAAALPEALITAWLALVETAALQPHERVLIHGGASGIGSMAIPLAKWRGATVIATAGTAAKAAFCLQRGADEAISYREQDFATLAPVDVVLDMVGGDYMAKNLKLLKRGGRLVQIAFLRGAKAELNLAPLLLNNLRWQGITLRTQPPARKAALIREAWAACEAALVSGALKMPIDTVFPLAEAAKAHERMQQNLNLGKILLKLAPSP